MAKLMALCLRLGLVLILSVALAQSGAVKAAAVEKELPLLATEQPTESPIADMALIAEDAPVVPKLPTEKPPVAPAAPLLPVAKASEMSSVEQVKPEEKASAQPHTVADFIIHPLIAFKPRQASLDELQAQGKQATPAGGALPGTSPGTWLFGMNPGQGLGSSFSTLAGSVSGWFNDRLAAAGQQLPALPGLPGLVDTPVRDSATSSSTPSPTTQRPEIVVRLQQRPNRRRGNGNGNGLNNLNNGNNGNRNGNRNGNLNGNRIQRPNRFNNQLDSLESEEYDDGDYYNGNRYDEEFYDDEQDVDELHHNDDDQSLEQLNDDEEEQQSAEQLQQQQKPKQQQQQRRRPAQTQPQQQRRRQQTQLQSQSPLPSASQSASQSQRRQQQVRRGQPLALLEQADEEEDEEELEDDEEADVELEDDEEDEEENYAPVVYKQSSRKSPAQAGFIQNGQQSLINQIRRFTFGQSPAELGTKLRKSQNSQSPTRTGAARRPQQTTLLVNRNGQTVYVAPELLNLSPGYPGYPNYGYVPAAPTKLQKQQQQHQRFPASPYPQPPLTVPLRRKGRPTQYITIPWSQLGLSAPDRQSVVSLAEGIQAQPLIFNIPESAISTVPVRGGATTTGQKKKKRPTLTAAAVPLLADASLMDIFQPPQIPPSRNGASSKPKPVLIAAKPVQAGGASGLLPTRIRPGTIVEKAPAMDTPLDSQTQSQSQSQSQKQKSQTPAQSQSQSQSEMQEKELADSATAPAAVSSEQAMDGGAAVSATPEQEFILVGEDNEPGLSRHVQPAYGDARYVSYGDFQPYFDLLHQNRRFALRKVGRALESEDSTAADSADSAVVQV